MVKSVVGGVAAMTAVYGASRAFVPTGTTSSTSDLVALRGASSAPAGTAANLCSQVAIGAVAGAACVAAVRGAKVARRGKYV
eukprot:CAMPEP_0178401632 /NCGR_PEP_ID=MMETSP0689_2-20121128/16405_1 /TAXON_ID=160604 /ORGANISM="Amphidinium massartii, Strain CS-259" /LENGTH=81 /DNA_ID=CAMNT_0020022465 /DNA_START=92 /DNA_END=334 /DNA_ORIENTATION=+